MRKLSTMFFSLVAFSLFGVTSTAFATPTASQITTPTGTAYVGILYGPNQATAVRGTTTGTGDVDLRCYYLGTGVTVKSNVHVTSANTFDTSLTQDDIANSLPARPCVLRAVPAGDTTAHPPSATSDPFQGPRIAPSYSNESVAPPSDATADFDVAGVGGSGLFQFESSWAGIWNSELVNPSTLATTPALFDIGAGFNGGDLINIDGVDAFVVNSLAS
ncbi:MAG: hypothetical protein QOE08_762, partial [Thermoleophilaceae bacterium]|nr:hypothetical protein [Thermoleophilaceae bacterium]